MTVVCWLFNALLLLLLVYVVFSWIPRPPEPLQPFVRALHRLVDPVLAPIRRVLPPLRLGGVGLDLSVLVVFFAILIIQGLLC